MIGYQKLFFLYRLFLVKFVFFMLVPQFSFSMSEDNEYRNEYEKIYSKVSDIRHPSMKELRMIQNYIKYGKRSYLKWLNTFYPEIEGDNFRYDLRARKMNLLHPKSSKMVLNKVNINTSSNNKETCIILYASYNPEHHYQSKINDLIKQLHNVGFKGHLLYRHGGWPDIEGGSLKLAHVPYAFKACMFREAFRLGYKKVVWFDASIKPLRDFSVVFDMLDSDGYFLISLDGWNLRSRGSEKLRKFYDLSIEDELNITTIVGGIVGINFASKTGVEIFNSWYKAAEDLVPYLSPRPDQNVLSVICHLMKLKPSKSLGDVCAIYKNEIQENHLFFIRY